MYMSYCRYEGTNAELRACFSDVEEHINEEAEYEVSDREIAHFRNMMEYIVSFLNENELLDEDGDLDQEALDRVCESMKQTCHDQEDEEEW